MWQETAAKQLERAAVLTSISTTTRSYYPEGIRVCVGESPLAILPPAHLELSPVTTLRSLECLPDKAVIERAKKPPLADVSIQLGIILVGKLLELLCNLQQVGSRDVAE